jgi:hypothetical protein
VHAVARERDHHGRKYDQWRYQNGELFFTVQDGETRAPSPKRLPLQKGRWYTLAVTFKVNDDHTGFCEATAAEEKGEGFRFKYDGKLGLDTDTAIMRMKFGVYTSFEPKTEMTQEFLDPRQAFYSNFERKVISPPEVTP